MSFVLVFFHRLKSGQSGYSLKGVMRQKRLKTTALHGEGLPKWQISIEIKVSKTAVYQTIKIF